MSLSLSKKKKQTRFFKSKKLYSEISFLFFRLSFNKKLIGSSRHNDDIAIRRLGLFAENAASTGQSVPDPYTIDKTFRRGCGVTEYNNNNYYYLNVRGADDVLCLSGARYDGRVMRIEQRQ